MIKLAFDPVLQRADFVRDGGNLETDEGLETAVMISLFTDARASDDDDIGNSTDKRGWWGEAFIGDGRHFGSKLWILRRSKMTDDSLAFASAYAKEALQWMVDDGVVKEITASATRLNGRSNAVVISIGITRPTKPLKKWQHAWEVQLGF